MYRARDRSRWRPRFSLAERQRRRQGAGRGFWSFSPWSPVRQRRSPEAERGFWSFSPRSPVRQMGYLGRDEPVRYRGFIGRDEVEEPSRLPERVPVPIRQRGFLSRKGKPLRTLL